MILSPANIKKTINYCKKNGLRDTVYASIERVQLGKKMKYSYQAPTDEELDRQKEYKFEYNPKLSLVVPAYETKPIYIEDLVIAVEESSYLNVELIIADASETPNVERMVKELQEQYDNIIYKRLDSNDGISENTNKGLEIATGDYIGLLDHDDLITADALYYIVEKINEKRKIDCEPIMIYTDEDKTDTYLESYYEPNIKTGLNNDMIMTNNYICHLTFIKSEVIKELRLRKEYDGAQDYDLFLRTIKYVRDRYGDSEVKGRIVHIPRILYHWRCHKASTAENPESKMYAYEAGRRAVEDYCKSLGMDVSVSHLKHLGFYRVDYNNKEFENNKYLGVVGGPVYAKNHIIAGAMDAKGNLLYGGLNCNFSGYLNRARLQQTVAGVDVRNIKLRDDLSEIFKEIIGYSYPITKESAKDKYYDNEYFKEKSLIFCNKLKNKGIEIMYEPEMELYIDKKGE